VYNLQLILGRLTYSRPQIIKNTINCKFVGAIHEYLQFSSVVVPILLPGCFIKCSRAGARSQDPNKYLKDAELLQTIVEENPEDTRSCFYCAQSYRDANRPEEALRYYLRRGEMINGYNEERFCSYLEAGKLIEMVRPDDLKSVTINYLKAYECNPNRVESLTYLAAYYRKHNLLSGAYLFAKTGSTITKPYDALFLESDCYDWKIHDELAVSAYWLGKYRESAAINERLLANSLVPMSHASRIIANLEACRNKM
jgi:tetratricopeptide (TPR) repeat protein